MQIADNVGWVRGLKNLAASWHVPGGAALFIGAMIVSFFTPALTAATPIASCGTTITPSSVLFFTDRERATDAQIFTGERGTGAGIDILTGGIFQPSVSQNSVAMCSSPQSLVDSLAMRFDRKRGRQVMIYVHGYFTSFRSAMETSSALQQALHFPGPVIAFSWPARVTSRLAYGTDEKNVGWAMDHFRLLVGAIERTYPGIPISFAVHSLGSRFMTGGIAYAEASGCKKCFGRALAFAPDESVGTLREALRGVGLCEGRPPGSPQHAAPVTIYVSNSDRALRASQRYHGGAQRAGQAGSEMLLCGGVDTVDVGYFKSSDRAGHSYQLDAPIAADASAALAGIRPTAPSRKLKQASRPGGDYYEL